MTFPLQDSADVGHCSAHRTLESYWSAGASRDSTVSTDRYGEDPVVVATSTQLTNHSEKTKGEASPLTAAAGRNNG